jgi:uncharacterized protein YtpQ (UPF0354 family)
LPQGYSLIDPSVTMDKMIPTLDSLARSPSNIVPIIKSSADAADLGQATWLEDVPLPIHRPLVENLLVMYSFDLPERFAFLNQQEASNLNLSLLELHDLAINNLLSRLENIDIQQMNDLPVFCLEIGGNLDASLMLLQEVRDVVANDVPGEIVAAVPSRDVFLVTGSDSTEGIAAIQAVVEDVWVNADHLLSQQLWIWQGEQWRALSS